MWGGPGVRNLEFGVWDVEFGTGSTCAGANLEQGAWDAASGIGGGGVIRIGSADRAQVESPDRTSPGWERAALSGCSGRLWGKMASQMDERNLGVSVLCAGNDAL